MAMVTFTADGHERTAYMALPAAGSGPGILFLHAWWGLNTFSKRTCDRLAGQGFVVVAPDLHFGKLATTIEDANHLVETQDVPAVEATAEAALRWLQSHPAVRGDTLGAVAFSMGAWFALRLDQLHPGALGRIVLFYGMSEGSFTASQAHFQCHFAEVDDFEPLENVQAITADNVEVHMYPGVGHWFFEEDRTGYFDADAAVLAWQRTLEFLGATFERDWRLAQRRGKDNTAVGAE